jgi:predicted Zn-dependent protease
MRQSRTRSIRGLPLAALLLATAPVALVTGGAPAAAQQAPGYGQPAPGYGQPRDAAAEAWAQILAKTPQSNDPVLNRRVRDVGQRLVVAAGAGNQVWDYRVFVDNSPNAFVLPGGRVGVNTGLSGSSRTMTNWPPCWVTRSRITSTTTPPSVRPVPVSRNWD